MIARRHRLRRRRRAGFTLVELMVSLVMFSFAIAGVLAVAVSMANGFREQRASVGTESAARSAMEFLGDAIRGASPGIGTGIIWPMDDSTCLTDPDAKKAFRATMGNASGTDSITVTFAYGSVVTTALTAYAQGAGGTMTLEDGSQLQTGDFVVVTDFAHAVLLKATDVSGNVLTYGTPACTTDDTAWTLAAGSLVVRAMRARFFVQTLDGVPTLYMDPDPTPSVTNDEEPLAEGIEDLQIVLGIDGADDGLGAENLATTNGDEWVGNVPGEAMPTTGAMALRAVRVSLVSRALTQVTGTAAYVRPPLEDHDGGTADNYRRRVLTSIIEVRNMLGSQ